MADYKRAAQLKLRIQTVLGLLSVEDTMDLSILQLKSAAIVYKKQLKSNGDDDDLLAEDVEELATLTEVDAKTQLIYDVLIDIIKTKIADKDRAAKAAETRAHNKKIDTFIAAKQKQELSELSVEDLEKLRR